MDLLEQKLSAAKMKGLIAVLDVIRKEKLGYVAGLHLAREYVEDSKGKIALNGDVVSLYLNEEEAHCFQLYPDLDLFYYEN